MKLKHKQIATLYFNGMFGRDFPDFKSVLKSDSTASPKTIPDINISYEHSYRFLDVSKEPEINSQLSKACLEKIIPDSFKFLIL